MLKVYGAIFSGNSYKVKALLQLLGTEHEWHEVDLLAGDARTDDFKQMNFNAKAPVLQTENGEFLPESNAILYYLAQGTDYFPKDSLQQARVMQWMFFEQYSHEPNIATSRFIHHYLELTPERLKSLEEKKAPGEKALAVMEHQLEQTKFLVGDRLTIADIALYAYTHVADEGGFSLDEFPAIRTWIKNIEQVPSFKNMQYFLT